MEKGLLPISIWASYGFTVGLLLWSLLYCFRSWNPRYLRLFPAYVAINLVLIIWAQPRPDHTEGANVVGVLLEQGYFTGFLFVLFRPGRMRKAIVMTTILSWILDGVLLIRYGPHKIDFFCAGLESLLLTIFCLLWFRQVFKYPVFDRLVDQPCYWFVTGLLFYQSIQLPAILFTAYELIHGHRAAAVNLFSANFYCLAVSYVLYGIGMAWRGSSGYRRRQRMV